MKYFDNFSKINKNKLNKKLIFIIINKMKKQKIINKIINYNKKKNKKFKIKLNK